MPGEDGADIPLYGRHPVLELLRSGSRRVEEIAILGEGRGPALQELLTLARRREVRVSYRTRDQLTAMAGTPHHQGVVARVAHAAYRPLDELLAIPAARGQAPFFMALDRIQDPMNLGAVLRTAEAAGVHGVILPRHQAVGLTSAVARAGMGAMELVPVARETNLVATLDLIRGMSIWVAGAVTSGGRPPWEIDLTAPLCLVLGGEGEGIRPLVSRRLDHLLTLPMRGRLQALNVSSAAAALCFEVVRQRSTRHRPNGSPVS
jgi:23S rRNA (guanosine2251-2'-O)-methyltransferase